MRVNITREPAPLQQRRHGAPVMPLQTIAPAGIAPTVAFGTPKIAGPILVSGIAPTTAIGSPTLTLGQLLAPTGIAPTSAVGSPTLAGPIVASGIAPTVAFGTPSLLVEIQPAGIAPTAAFGTPRIAAHISPTGIAPTVAFGTAIIAGNQIQAQGIGQTVAFGIPGFAGPLIVPGIAPTTGVGTPRITEQQTIAPSGIASTLAIGTPGVHNSQTIGVSGIAPTVAFGTARIAGSPRRLIPTGIAPTVGFGFPTLSGGASSWRCWIGGVDCTKFLRIGTANMTGQAVGRWKLTFQWFDPSGQTAPVIGQQFLITEGSFKWFAGCIVETEFERIPKTGLNFVNCSAQDYTSICDRRTVKTTTYKAGQDIADVLRLVMSQWMDGEGITTHAIPESLGSLDADLTVNYDTVTNVLNQLAGYAGVVWWVDVNQDMHASGLAGLVASPFGFSETSKNWRNLRVNYSLIQGDGYRNIQYAISNLSTTPATPQRDDTFVLPQPQAVAAGFVLGSIILPFPAARIVSLKVNGVVQPFYSGLDFINFRHVWWTFPGTIYIVPPAAQNANTLPDPTGGTSADPNSGDVVEISWIPSGANNVAAIEGSALDPSSLVPPGITPIGSLRTIGSGKWEAVALAQDADTQQQLDLLASSELARSGGVPIVLTAETDEPGLMVGQKLPADLALSFAPSKQMLISKVTAQEMAVDKTGRLNDLGFGSCWRWQIEARTNLDAFSTWVNFYEKLIRRTKLPLPLPIYQTSTFILAPGSSLSGGTSITNPDIIGAPPGVVTTLRIAASDTPVDQDLVVTLSINGTISPLLTITLPGGTPANTVIEVDIDPSVNPIYLFQGDVVNANATYVVTGPSPQPAGSVTLKVDRQV